MLIRINNWLLWWESLLVGEIYTLFITIFLHHGFCTVQVRILILLEHRACGCLQTSHPFHKHPVPASHLCLHRALKLEHFTLYSNHLSTHHWIHPSKSSVLIKEDINEKFSAQMQLRTNCNEGESSPTFALSSPGKWCGKGSHFHNS